MQNFFSTFIDEFIKTSRNWRAMSVVRLLYGCGLSEKSILTREMKLFHLPNFSGQTRHSKWLWRIVYFVTRQNHTRREQFVAECLRDSQIALPLDHRERGFARVVEMKNIATGVKPLDDNYGLVDVIVVVASAQHVFTYQ